MFSVYLNMKFSLYFLSHCFLLESIESESQEMPYLYIEVCIICKMSKLQMVYPGISGSNFFFSRLE